MRFLLSQSSGLITGEEGYEGAVQEKGDWWITFDTLDALQAWAEHYGPIILGNLPGVPEIEVYNTFRE